MEWSKPMFLSPHSASCKARCLQSQGWKSSVLLGSGPVVIEIVSLMRTYFHVHLKEALGMLDEMKKPLEMIR